MIYRTLPTMLVLSAAGHFLFPLEALSAQTADEWRALQERLAEQDRRIADLERRLAGYEDGPILQEEPTDEDQPYGGPKDAKPAAANVLQSDSTAPPITDRLSLSGDVSVREEFNWVENGGVDSSRSVFRARLRGQYKVNDVITIGAGVASGDGTNPRARHVTISDFGDSFPFQVDLAYMQFDLEDLSIYAGQIPQPLRRTDLVWDGDVNPKGVGLIWRHPTRHATLEARGLYYILDKGQAGRGGDVLGGQLAVDLDMVKDLDLVLASGYFSYSLRNLANPDPANVRGNRLGTNGSYLSDFHLGNALAMVTYRGFDDRWPISLSADFVHNFGAVDEEDTGFAIAASAGRAAHIGDWHFAASYTQAETDAVMALLSHDNIPVSTNYKLISGSVDFVPIENLVLNLTWYRFRSLDRTLALPETQPDWANRVRANVTVQF